MAKDHKQGPPLGWDGWPVWDGNSLALHIQTGISCHSPGGLLREEWQFPLAWTPETQATHGQKVCAFPEAPLRSLPWSVRKVSSRQGKEKVIMAPPKWLPLCVKIFSFLKSGYKIQLMCDSDSESAGFENIISEKMRKILWHFTDQNKSVWLFPLIWPRSFVLLKHGICMGYVPTHLK